MSTVLQYPYEEDIPFPLKIRGRTDINWGEKAYLAEILSIGRISGGKCYYNIKSLAARLHVSPLTIMLWTKKLTSLGLINVVVDLDGTRDTNRIIKPTEAQ